MSPNSQNISSKPDHDGFLQKGIWNRIKMEYLYFVSKDWPISDVGQFWDAVADYDDINEKTYSYFRRFTDGFNISTIPDNSYVLEVTPRTGNGALFYHKRNKIAKVALADVSQFQMDICHKNLTENNVPFESVKLESYHFPFEDGQFDAVLSFETVEHMGDPITFVKEIGRVLKPGGELILTCPNILWEPVHWLAAVFKLHHSEGPHNFLTRKQLYDFFDRADLQVEVETAGVLIPFGSKVLIRFGEWLEQTLPERVIRALALRRVFRCRKVG